MKKAYSASITPLTPDKRLDEKSLERMIERNLRHGLNGIFVLGTMGEWSHLNNETRDRMIRSATEIMNGRGEVLAGIHATGLDLTLNNMERVAGVPFDSYVIMLPPNTSQLNPMDYLKTVLDAADRPVYYYHYPLMNGMRLGMPQFRELVRHPRFKGLKNSSGDMMLRKELILLKQEFDFVLLEGHEWAMDESLIMGCDGVLCGLGALGSRLMVSLARAVDAGDYERAKQLQQALIHIFHGIYGADLQTVWVGEKYALKHLGILDSETTLVQSEALLTPGRRAEIEACLDQFREELD